MTTKYNKKILENPNSQEKEVCPIMDSKKMRTYKINYRDLAVEAEAKRKTEKNNLLEIRWSPQKRRSYYYINGFLITNLFTVNGCIKKRLIASRDLIDSINDNEQFHGAYALATDTKSQELMKTKFFKEKGLSIYVKNEIYMNIRYFSDGLPSDGKTIILSSDNTLARWECPFLGKAITIFYDKY
jgi:hypothetical protein